MLKMLTLGVAVASGLWAQSRGSASVDLINVLSAVGMRQVLVELAPTLEREAGRTINLTFDSGATFVREDEMPGARLARGEAEVALHQIQELMAVPGVVVVGPLPGDLDGQFHFAAAVVSGSRHADAVRQTDRLPRYAPSARCDQQAGDAGCRACEVTPCDRLNGDR